MKIWLKIYARSLWSKKRVFLEATHVDLSFVVFLKLNVLNILGNNIFASRRL